MKVVTENVIIQIMREEWKRKVEALQRELDMHYKPQQGEKAVNIISIGLKVRDKAGILYTVAGVHPNRVALKSPEGKVVQVSADEFEKTFEQDADEFEKTS